MAVAYRTALTDIQTTRCRLTWRGDFAELHARSGLLTLDLDDRTITLSPQPTCMHPIARELATILASGFGLGHACGGCSIRTGPDDLLEFIQIGECIALYPDSLPDGRILVPSSTLRRAITTFLREYRG